MSADRHHKLQTHRRLCNTLARRKRKLWQLLSAITAFSFVCEVMDKHAMFVTRLVGVRSLSRSRYFAGLDFIFVLPVFGVVAARGKSPLRMMERLVAVRPQPMRFFHTAESKSILHIAGNVSLPPAVAPPSAPMIPRWESQPAANDAKYEISFFAPNVSRNTGRGQDFPNIDKNLLQPQQGLLNFFRLQLLNSISYNLINKQPQKPGVARREPAGDERNASTSKVEALQPTSGRFHNALTTLATVTGMPNAGALSSYAGEVHSNLSLPNLIVAQSRFTDFLPEKRPMENSSGKNRPATAAALELIHKANKAFEGKGQAQTREAKDDTHAEAVAQRRLKPIGIAEPPMPEAFLNLDGLADHVITIIEKRLQTERERRGIFA